jgi:hypothetical protein
LELLDVHGKHKGLVNYNKNHDISTLKKHACHEHLYLYKNWGLFILQRVIEAQSEKCGSKKTKLVPPFQNTNSFVNQQPYHKSNLLQQALLENLVFYFAKGY